METTTRTKILSLAERLLRTRGYADFSYADLVDEVGVRKASIHHHFPTKEQLGVEVVEDYLARFREELEAILGNDQSAPRRLSAYAELFSASLFDGTFPLCTALAAELAALPERMQDQTRAFFQIHLDWLERVVQQGKKARELDGAPAARKAANILLNAIEGGAVVAWALGKPESVTIGFDELVRLWSSKSR
ncbi:TetR family transcriptional regulator [Caballeronia hypogeia]|uniref:TetR family transcriptional regulator n=1 Tax=Caballeronia hypogeia TaxID=1777140 RepID=A0A158CTP1_9BURK|nr:TetR/AcrR family transcriptional regulator [Caballeronia hypogeia]SAK85688.1 TetR family transcriptional regulator [Caballeronia hypogeia]